MSGTWGKLRNTLHRLRWDIRAGIKRGSVLEGVRDFWRYRNTCHICLSTSHIAPNCEHREYYIDKFGSLWNPKKEK